MSELRISHRLKCEDLDRLSNIYEENLANLKATKLENEMIREKVMLNSLHNYNFS